MTEYTKCIMNWSGGKDSAFCLYKILQEKQYDVMCLLTTISEQYQRISMHGVRSELLDLQASSIGIPLVKIQLPEMPSMEIYDRIMIENLSALKSRGATLSVYGDIFLEDLRNYREKKLSEINLKGVFPLWKIPTGNLIREFIESGFKTIVTCVNDKYLDKSFAGRIINHDFLMDLPSDVDPCGENGEFHTFVFDGPIFKEMVPFEKGEIVYRKYETGNRTDDVMSNNNEDRENADDPFGNGFWYCDLIVPGH